MPRFSANLSLLFTELPILERFGAAKKCGFEWVEIQFPYGSPAEDLKAAIEQAGVKLALFNVPADDLLAGGEGLAAVPEKRETYLDAVDIAIEYAKILNPLSINILAGRCLRAHRYGDYLQTFIGNLGYTAQKLSGLGIRAVFEAVNTKDMPGFIINKGQQMLDVVNQLNHPNLFMQYDIYHMHTMGENPIEFIPKHHDKIGHIQFADSPGRGQPGSGEIEFPLLFNRIDDSGYDGLLGAEYIPVGATQDSLEWLNN